MKRSVAQMLALVFAVVILVMPALAEDGGRIVGVPLANAKSGHPDNVMSPGFQLVRIAQGTDKLENPSGILTNFGLLNDGAQQKFEPTRLEGTRMEITIATTAISVDLRKAKTTRPEMSGLFASKKGTAPERIIATKYVDDDRAKGVAMTRPLCPYPQAAKYKGSGDPNDAANFVCAM